MTVYPEHEKLAAIPEGERDRLNHFLEWLDDQGYRIAEWKESSDNWPRVDPELVEVMKSHDKIMAEFLGINMKAIEREKRAMLAEFREANREQDDTKTS